jgi:hypothetical protein
MQATGKCNSNYTIEVDKLYYIDLPPCLKQTWRRLLHTIIKEENIVPYLFQFGQSLLNPCPGLFNISHTIGKREAHTIRLTKSLPHYG